LISLAHNCIALGFNVTSAPVSIGRVSYKVTVVEDASADVSTSATTHTATYAVDLTATKGGAAFSWGVKWPQNLAGAGATCTGCTVVAQDHVLGLVKVKPTAGATSFTVTAQWSSN
jgi:hypothetical protein